jgi:hypothetical protein
MDTEVFIDRGTMMGRRVASEKIIPKGWFDRGGDIPFEASFNRTNTFCSSMNRTYWIGV